MNIRAVYHAPNGAFDKDDVALAIATKFGAKLQGSGCWLEEPFERDLEWRVERTEGLKMIVELRQAGLKVMYD